MTSLIYFFTFIYALSGANVHDDIFNVDELNQLQPLVHFANLSTKEDHVLECTPLHGDSAAMKIVMSRTEISNKSCRSIQIYKKDVQDVKYTPIVVAQVAQFALADIPMTSGNLCSLGADGQINASAPLLFTPEESAFTCAKNLVPKVDVSCDIDLVITQITYQLCQSENGAIRTATLTMSSDNPLKFFIAIKSFDPSQEEGQKPQKLSFFYDQKSGALVKSK